MWQIRNSILISANVRVLRFIKILTGNWPTVGARSPKIVNYDPGNHVSLLLQCEHSLCHVYTRKPEREVLCGARRAGKMERD